MTETGPPGAFVLVVIRRDGDIPRTIDVATRLGIDRDAIDDGFGVIPLDSVRHLWCARIRLSALPHPDLNEDDLWIAADATIQSFP